MLIDKLRRAYTGESASAQAEQEAAPVAERAAYRVLFVCMGNICRSPTAEGVFRRAVASGLPDLPIEIDSAGTHAYHTGEAPDPRARRAAEGRGVDLSGLRARRVAVEDFERFDLVLAMDQLNHVTLMELCPPEYRSRVRLFLEFAPQIGRLDVPDPYYGGGNGFEHVLDLVDEASAGLLAHLKKTLAER
jgi:protein-tyrosine phosphatase